MRLAIAAIFALTSFGLSASTGVAATQPTALPDCQGKLLVKPASITLACGDGNFYVENLKWTGWGQSFAAATGTAKANDCRPNCAAGHFHSYPMLLIVTGSQSCGGHPAYARVVYAFVGRSPYPQSTKVEDSTQTFPCSK
jgi:hypothetical protein